MYTRQFTTLLIAAAYQAQAIELAATNSVITDYADLVQGLEDDIDTLQGQNLDSRLTSVEGTATSNAGRLDTLEALDIGTGLTTLSADLDTAEGNIATNLASIGTLTSDLSALGARVTTEEGNVDTLQSELDTAEANIATNLASVGTLTTRADATDANVASNLASIGTLTTNLASTDGNVSAVTSTANLNSASIVALDGRVSTAEGEIDTLQLNQGTL